MSECSGVMGRLFGHNFKARYDETSEIPLEIFRRLESAEGGVTSLRRKVKTYRGDVCTRCGEKVCPVTSVGGEMR